MSWAPIKPTSENGGKAIFRPGLYGVPGGVDPAVDMPLVQAAINAAEAISGGAIVRLEATYAILEADSIQCGNYANTFYGVWVLGDDVILDGNGTGTLVLDAMPAHTRYAMILVGDGGYQVGSFPGIDTLLATGNITKRTQIKDLDIDCSVLTDPNMASLAGDVLSGNILFVFCQDFTADGVTIDRGFGNNGGIGCVASCRNWTVQNCTITTCYDVGFFADGAKYGTYDTCTVNGDIVIGTAFNIGTSGDYDSYSEDCTVRDCIVDDVHDGIAISAGGGTVTGNTITLADVNLTRLGITVTVGYSVAADVDADGEAVVTGNTIQRPIGAAFEQGFGVYLNGRNIGYSGDPIEVRDCTITGNAVNRMTYGLALGLQAKDNVFTGNTLTDCAEYVDVSGGTASGNTIGPNP